MSNNRFNYLVEKIRDAKFSDHPFRHIYIEDFFSESDFKDIISSTEINLNKAHSDEDLFNKLFEHSYEIVPFAGCTNDKEAYIKWHAGKKTSLDFNTACSGIGVALRLENPKTEILIKIKEFLAGDLFNQTISEKLGHNLKDKIIDNGIQKYLDGYEISPHPDIRKKAVTFMININPHENAEQLDHHAHLLKFKPERDYIRIFWQGNNNVDRCLFPWDWATINKTQNKNNTLVLFAPKDDTLHAVRANYDHLNAQRTQLYGNIWHESNMCGEGLTWEELDFMPIFERKEQPDSNIVQAAKKLIPKSLKKVILNTMYPHNDLAFKNKKNVNTNRLKNFKK